MGGMTAVRWVATMAPSMVYYSAGLKDAESVELMAEQRVAKKAASMERPMAGLTAAK